MYGKIVQIHLWENWTRNAVGILNDSLLGEEYVMIAPVPISNELLKTLQVNSVAKPLHVNKKDISGIFELEFSYEQSDTTGPKNPS